MATGPASRGDRRVPVDTTRRLHPGQQIFLAWRNPPDNSLLVHMAGGSAMAAFPWQKAKGLTRLPHIVWPVAIDRVEAGAVILAQPLRLDVRPEWRVRVRPNPHYIEEVGVEDLGIEMASGEAPPHHQETGFNAIFLHRVINGWVRNVWITGADNGVLLESTKHITVEGLRLAGARRFHHGIYAKESHDALFTGFDIEAPMIHGLNVDILCSGLVWSAGRLKHGTFDMHHGLSFDLLRTNLDIVNDGKRGGTEEWGPVQGARAVHWNVRVTGSGRQVNQPDVMPQGALVGVQGTALDLQPYRQNFIPGDKGCLVADPGLVPDPSDLYQAQLSSRLQRNGRGARRVRPN